MFLTRFSPKNLVRKVGRVPSRVRRDLSDYRFYTYLAILGPGIIAANAGNDASGIATYSTVGASYGYALLWVFIPMVLSLIIVQEMCVRMGVVTGQGLADLIREQFGVRWTAFIMVALLVANTGVIISEFVGIAQASEMLGIPRYFSIPLTAGVIWWLVVRGSQKRVERVFLLMSLVFFSYVISAFASKPEWGVVGESFVSPSFSLDTVYLFTIMALIGTTITPFMQVFVQSSVVEKGMDKDDLPLARADVIAGTTFAGAYAKYLFAVGLFGAAMLAMGVLPLATAYSVSEALGFEKGLSRSFREAPIFLGIFTALILIGAVVALIPGIPQIRLLLFTQSINGVLLPIILVAVLSLANNEEIMGEYRNTVWFNIAAFTTTAVISVLSLLLIGKTI